MSKSETIESKHLSKLQQLENVLYKCIETLTIQIITHNLFT
ncbi:rCG47003 [Rattus norvegicus]|uniref:RCG47003 n=1 Tax=Rattus norvegicus TaxID=10116 RepID=A6K4Y2_RAT|nr:rCG47003 [Rattus norvegicus]